MKKLSFIISCILVMTNFTACSSKTSDTENTPAAAPAYSENISFDEYENLNKINMENGLDKDFIKAMEDFSYTSASKFLSGENKNVCYSPASLYMALSIAGLGAEGNTREEIFSALGMNDKTEDYLAEQNNKLFSLLHSDNGIGKIKAANSLWIKESLMFNENFLDKIGKSVFASLYRVNFTDNRTSELMRDWISDNTMGVLSPEIELGKEQIMSILNTIYFKDEWIDRFIEEETKADTFYLSDGNTVQCDFMNSSYVTHGFTRGMGFTASSLYLKNDGSMIFILPDEGVSVDSLLSTPEKAAALFRGGKNINGKVIFQIPKFSYGSNLELKDTLEAIGVKAAFKNDADFSGITEETAFISSLKQQTHVTIDEKGIEAAAFTQIDYAGAAPPKDEVAEMILNRPFIFAIKYKDKLIFTGVVNNPNQK